MTQKVYWDENDPLAKWYEKEIVRLRKLDTVEEVEKIHCNECSSNGHWGWCDAPWIKCTLKWRIKEILGETDSRYHSIKEQFKEQFPEVFKEWTKQSGHR